MARNKRKVYGEEDATGETTDRDEEAKPCPACGCRHFFFFTLKAYTTGEVKKKTCRNCGTVVAVS